MRSAGTTDAFYPVVRREKNKNIMENYRDKIQYISGRNVND